MINLIKNRIGFYSWIIQRFTALLFFLYTISIFLIFFINKNNINFLKYKICNSTIFCVSLIIALIIFFIHAFIGLWTVLTDYIKCFYLKKTIELLFLIYCILIFRYTINILWSN